MQALLALIDGKKTYLVAVLIGLGGFSQALGYELPDWTWPLLQAAGLGAVRDALPSKKPA
jgi:hypothetical protein